MTLGTGRSLKDECGFSLERVRADSAEETQLDFRIHPRQKEVVRWRL